MPPLQFCKSKTKRQTPKEATHTEQNQAKQFVKSKLRDYLEAKQINTAKPFRCLNPSHEDRNPSMSYDAKREKVHCFSCGADYDIFDLISIEYRLTDAGDIFRKAYELYGGVPPLAFCDNVVHRNSIVASGTQQQSGNSIQAKPKPQWASFLQNPTGGTPAYFEECKARLHETDYHRTRGISDQTAARFGLGFDPCCEGTGWRALIIPTGHDSYVARNTDPNADKKNRYRKTGAAQLFNSSALSQTDKPIYVVEGEFDALALAEIGENAVALGSTANVGKLIEHMKQAKDKKPSMLLIAMDNDEAGEAARDKLISELAALHIPAYSVSFAPYKDASEALCADRDAFIKRIADCKAAPEAAERAKKQAESEAYAAKSTAASIPEFLASIKANRLARAIPTAFSALDRTLDGGLYEGLYIVGAISSLGKTTFVMQIADAIAESKTDVLVFSLEMSKCELMAKSVSRLAATDGCKLTVRDIMRGNIAGEASRQKLTHAIERLAVFGKYQTVLEAHGCFTAADIEAHTREHVRITGRAPVVIVDYLQILSPLDARATDKQNTDRAVAVLKQLSRDMHTPVIAISSFNRDNYTAKVSMQSFKESGAIEYSSDVLIGMQLKGAGEKDFDVDAEKRKNPREVEVKILKNRNGMTGDALPFDYYPAYNLFRERKERDGA